MNRLSMCSCGADAIAPQSEAEDATTRLELAPGIKQQVFGLYIPVCDAVCVEVVEAGEELLERALEFRGAHAPFANGCVQVAPLTKLHDLAPRMALVLQKIDRLDDIGVVERRRDAKLRGKLLDVIFFALVLPALPELLEKASVSGTEQWVQQMKRQMKGQMKEGGAGRTLTA